MGPAKKRKISSLFPVGALIYPQSTKFTGMKLILKDNYLLLKLSPRDLKRFAEVGEVEESVVLGEYSSDKFVFALEASHAYEHLQVNLIANEMRISMPKEQAVRWLSSDETGFGAITDVGEGRELRLAVERMSAEEDEVGAFPYE
jgi:hypothetical protein